jgi:hypothetical protein
MTIGKLLAWAEVTDFANTERDIAANEALTADILMNLRRLYISLI